MLLACVAAFVATATVLSVSMAATGTFAASKSKAKAKSTGLSRGQVIALIKQYSKAGATGAAGATGPAGAAGATGSAGPKGEAGTKGEPGSNGEPGTKGEPGANGAVAGYSVSQPPTGPAEGTPFTAGTLAAPTTILSKSLPAGSYLASAKVQVTLVATGAGGEGDVSCELLDTPTSGSAVADEAGFFSATDAAIPEVGSGTATTLPLDVAVSASSASTLAIKCWVVLSSGGQSGGSPGLFFAEASNAHIQAVQTTANN